MYLVFILSMPNKGSWDGKWSGSDNLYAIVKNFTGKALQRAKEIIKEESFYYNFGDGWGASISVKEIDVTTARKFRRNTKGFCGYDWMVQSIIDNLEIKGN